MDALALVENEGKSGEYTWFKVEPGTLYPHALLELIQTGVITEADALTAIKPRDGLTVEERQVKANTLGRARIHFLQTLIAQFGKGVGLHILDVQAEQWRL